MKDFFDEFRGVRTAQNLITTATEQQAANIFGFGYTILKWVWIFLLSFTIISTVIALVRMAILADDVPMKKAQAKHDFAASMVMLAVMGATPFIFRIILMLLNMMK